MTVGPASDVLERSVRTASEAAWPAGLPFRIGAPAEQLNPAQVRWEVAQTVSQRCAAISSARLDDLLLVVSELATNAIRHGGGGLISVMVSALADGISLRVYDGTTVPPRLKDPDEATEEGRGLRLVDELTAHDWGHRLTPGGKYVWALITYDLPRPTAASNALVKGIRHDDDVRAAADK
jgi:anti-sigma regulatory factor (Ser/Thr protein kinase)